MAEIIHWLAELKFYEVLILILSQVKGIFIKLFFLFVFYYLVELTIKYRVLNMQRYYFYLSLFMFRQ